MTTQDINRYITVANNWERKYSKLSEQHDKLKEYLSSENIIKMHNFIFMANELIEDQKKQIAELQKREKQLTIFCIIFCFLLLFSGLQRTGII